MKITVLMDNNTYIDKYYLGEPAVSYYIEVDNKKILFDTGYSDAFIKNAEDMNIDLSKLDYIILSHGHNDHTRGLMYLNNKYDLSKTKIISHPGCFEPKYFEGQFIGAPFTLQDMYKFDYNPSKKPYNITENCVFLGEIPELNDFEIRNAIGVKEDLELCCSEFFSKDYILDDSAICINTKEGIFIITGCSHSGICNIVEYSKQILKSDKILGILGGFHLFEIDERLNKTIEYLQQQNIKKFYPCHCVSLKAKSEMMKKLGVEEVGVGLEINM